MYVHWMWWNVNLKRTAIPFAHDVADVIDSIDGYSLISGDTRKSFKRVRWVAVCTCCHYWRKIKSTSSAQRSGRPAGRSARDVEEDETGDAVCAHSETNHQFVFVYRTRASTECVIRVECKYRYCCAVCMHSGEHEDGMDMVPCTAWVAAINRFRGVGRQAICVLCVWVCMYSVSAYIYIYITRVQNLCVVAMVVVCGWLVAFAVVGLDGWTTDFNTRLACEILRAEKNAVLSLCGACVFPFWRRPTGTRTFGALVPGAGRQRWWFWWRRHGVTMCADANILQFCCGPRHSSPANLVRDYARYGFYYKLKSVTQQKKGDV